MARMIPAQIGPEAPTSEVEIFRRFRDQTPSSWTVIHSQCFVTGGDEDHPARDGEIDFLVLDPERGFVVLEVKGGGIRFESGQWYSTGQDQIEKAIKDPAVQARKGAHEVNDFLRKQPWFIQNKVRPHFGWGVVFPDADIPAITGLGLPRDHILDRMDCTRFLAEIERLMTTQGLQKGKQPQQLTRAFQSAICPSVRARVPLARWFRDEQEILDRLTHEQVALLDHLERVPRLAVEGAAGSGKTVVAMEKARRLAADGKQVQFLCYNHPLAVELSQYAEGFAVHTFHDLSLQLVQRAGIQASVPKGAKEKNRFFEEELPIFLLDALAVLPDERNDAVVVDEGQDFKADWWPCVKELLKEPANGILYVFYDPVQDIYSRGIPEIVKSYPFPLRYNCRNTERITDYCRGLCDSKMETFPGTPEGVEVQQFQAKGRKDLTSQLGRVVKRLIEEESVKAVDMVLLSTRSRKKSILSGVKMLGPLTLASLNQATASQLRFDSLFQFKGLEADVVLLIDEGHARTSTPKHLYVGASRARHFLVVATLETPQSEPESEAN